MDINKLRETQPYHPYRDDFAHTMRQMKMVEQFMFDPKGGCEEWMLRMVKDARKGLEDMFTIFRTIDEALKDNRYDAATQHQARRARWALATLGFVDAFDGVGNALSLFEERLGKNANYANMPQTESRFHYLLDSFLLAVRAVWDDFVEIDAEWFRIWQFEQQSKRNEAKAKEKGGEK